VRDLPELAERVAVDPGYARVAPITRRRAESQVRNPHARPEDIALLTAFDGRRCIGYHGLMPQLLRSGGEQSTVYWVTTFFVTPEYRGHGVGRRLLEWIKGAGIDYITPQMTPSAERAYRSAGYRELGHLTYYQLRVDRLASANFLLALGNRKNASRSAAGENTSRLPGRLHDGLYGLRKRFFFRKVSGLLPEAASGLHVRRVERIDPSHQPTLEMRSERPYFFRGVDIINWMMSHPWLVSRQAASDEVNPYYFSRVRDRFEYVAHEIDSREATHPIGFFVHSISSKRGRARLKLLDHDLPTEGAFLSCVRTLLLAAGALSLDRIEYPAAFRRFFEVQPVFKKLIKKQSRLYLYHPAAEASPLARAAADIELDYCDGDTAFT
jgi:GNAT superfamily N-acetyltransferase